MRREKERSPEEEFDRQFHADIWSRLLSPTFWLDGLASGFGMFSTTEPKLSPNKPIRQFNLAEVQSE